MRRAPAALALGLLGQLAACRAGVPRVAVHLATLRPAAASGLGADQGRPRLLSLALGDETQQALVAPVPSRIEYELRVPERGVLSFAIARSGAGERVTAAGAIRFRLGLGSTDGGQLLFERDLPPRRAERWLPATVDLSAWSGHTVRLRLEVDGEPAVAGELALWGHPLVAPRPAARRERLLLLVSIDCLRADHVGAYGYARDTTPNIDRLARDGVVFENAVAAATSTFFAHTSMLTGLPPSLHGARRERRLSRNVGFLPELLERAGWETEGFVAWDLVSASFGFDRGYHAYRMDREHDGARLVDAVLAGLEYQLPRRFVFLHLFEPHWPYLPPPELRERFGPRPPDISGLLDKVGGDLPPAGDDREQLLRLYDAEIAFADAQLGRLLDALRERGLYDEALVVVTADHGEAFFEHGHWEHTETLFEEIVRVPLVVKWPRGLGVAGGQRVSDPVGQIDVFPTLLAAAGVVAPAPEARPLLRTLRAGGADRVVVSEAAWHHPERTLLKVALRGRRYKYVALLEGPAEPEFEGLELRSEQLYDLEQDPAERHDLIADPPVELALLRGRLEEHLDRAHDVDHARRGERVELDAATLQRLHALGYVH